MKWRRTAVAILVALLVVALSFLLGGLGAEPVP
jgi:hypothetical protein